MGVAIGLADEYLDGLIDDFRIYDQHYLLIKFQNFIKCLGLMQMEMGLPMQMKSRLGLTQTPVPVKPELSNGLLLWYPLDGNTSDISGNSRHATLSNANGSTAGFVDGKILKALDFDGVDDFLTVPHDNGLDLRRTMSLSLWLKLDTIPSTGYSTILYKGGGNGGSSSNLFLVVGKWKPVYSCNQCRFY